MTAVAKPSDTVKTKTEKPVPVSVAAGNESQKIEKPSEEVFNKEKAELQKKHDALRKELNEVKEKINDAGSGARDPKQQELRDELSKIRAQVATKKGVQNKIQDQIKALQDQINFRSKELQAKQKTIPYKTVAELEAAVAKLDSKVESGTMKIVDEKKALAEISQLNRQKRNFGNMEEAHRLIDADRAKLKEMKEKKQDSELVELNKKYDTLQTELNELRSKSDNDRKNLNELRDSRTALQKKVDECYHEMKAHADTYYQTRKAYHKQVTAQRKAREERFERERKERELERKKKIAEERMEAASTPAFQNEILICEGLIGFFDPSSAEAARKAKNATVERDLAAKPLRAAPTEFKGEKLGKVLVREEIEYFVGKGGKKGGKKGRKSPKPAEEGAEAAAVPKDGRINLNSGTLEELSRVGVETPTSQAGVAKTLEDLHEKLAYYKENQKKVTAENIANAKKELEKFEADENQGPEIPAADAVKTDEKTEEAAAEEKEEETAATPAAEEDNREDNSEAVPAAEAAAETEEEKESTEEAVEEKAEEKVDEKTE